MHADEKLSQVIGDENAINKCEWAEMVRSTYSTFESIYQSISTPQNPIGAKIVSLEVNKFYKAPYFKLPVKFKAMVHD
jgi:hypothetical protein